LSWLSNHEHGLGIGFVLEGSTSSHDHRPELSNDSGA
jgi:hypothetical protein